MYTQNIILDKSKCQILFHVFLFLDCGVSIGEDGPSQMALEDLAMFRSLPGCTVFYPSDAVATERAIELAANTKVRFIEQKFTMKWEKLLL